MDKEKSFDRLKETFNDSAKRQDEVFNRIEDIVSENPEAAKQYLKHLTQTSKWELYGRIYAKFAYISLLIAFIVVALIVGLKKVNGDEPKTLIQKLSVLEDQPDLNVEYNKGVDKWKLTYQGNDTTNIQFGDIDKIQADTLSFSDGKNGLWDFKNKDLKVGFIPKATLEECFKKRTEVRGVYNLKYVLDFENEVARPYVGDIYCDFSALDLGYSLCFDFKENAIDTNNYKVHLSVELISPSDTTKVGLIWESNDKETSHKSYDIANFEKPIFSFSVGEERKDKVEYFCKIQTRDITKNTGNGYVTLQVYTLKTTPIGKNR